MKKLALVAALFFSTSLIGQCFLKVLAAVTATASISYIGREALNWTLTSDAELATELRSNPLALEYMLKIAQRAERRSVRLAQHYAHLTERLKIAQEEAKKNPVFKQTGDGEQQTPIVAEQVTPKADMNKFE